MMHFSWSFLAVAGVVAATLLAFSAVVKGKRQSWPTFLDCEAEQAAPSDREWDVFISYCGFDSKNTIVS
jgi:hypothetical protein